MSSMEVARVALLGFVVTVATSPVVLKVLRDGHIMDVPSDRSSHVVPTPRGGGLACLLGLLGAVVLAPGLGAGPKVLLCSSAGALALLGLVDDLRSLRVRLRFGVQIVVAVIASCWAFDVSGKTSVWAVGLAVGGAAWITAYVNAFNFMDGVNGLAGAAAALAGLTFVLIGLDRGDATLAVGGGAMSGAALAFLPWNFPRARFFLGDVGSYLLGGTTALLVAIGVRHHLPFEALIGPEVVFLADTGWTLAGRIARGEAWTTPHRGHVYQRLQARDASHVRTTLSISTLVATTAALGLVSLSGVLWARLLADAAGAALVVAYLASPRMVRRPAEVLA